MALFGWGPLVHSAMGARPRGAVTHSHACEDTPPVPSRMRETDIEMKRHTRTERCPHRKGSTVIGPGPPSADSGTRTQRRRLWPLPPLLLHCYLPWSVLTFGLCEVSELCCPSLLPATLWHLPFNTQTLVFSAQPPPPCCSANALPTGLLGAHVFISAGDWLPDMEKQNRSARTRIAPCH